MSRTTSRTAAGTAASTAGLNPNPWVKSYPSIPMTTTRDGARPTARPSRSAPTSPIPWLLVDLALGGSGTRWWSSDPDPTGTDGTGSEGGSVRSMSRIEPGLAPERTASTTMASLASSQRFKRSRGSTTGPMSRARSSSAARVRHDDADTVVVSVLAPEAGDDDAADRLCRARVSHRSISTSRKWAAHEMQGS